MKRSFSEGRCIDYPDLGEEDEDILRKVNSEVTGQHSQLVEN